MIDHILISSGLATGGAGVATANKTSDARLTGRVLGFYVKYNDAPPGATTDVTIEATGGVMPTRTLLTITNSATDGFFAIRQVAHNQSHATITNSFVEIPLVDDKLKVTIAQANDNDSIDVWAVIER